MNAIDKKAKELVDKFKPFLYKGLTNPKSNEVKVNAKACAIICVDEIIEENKKQAKDSVDDFRLLYWQQVKERLLAKQ